MPPDARGPMLRAPGGSGAGGVRPAPGRGRVAGPGVPAEVHQRSDAFLPPFPMQTSDALLAEPARS